MNSGIIKVNHTHMLIPNYELGDCEELERQLSTWDKICYRFNPIGFYYDEERKLLRIPRGLDISYIERKFPSKLIEFSYTPDPYDKVVFTLRTMPKSDIQKKSIAFLLGEEGFKYTKKYSQQSLNLDTGDGKTYCVIASLTFLNMKSLIVTHTESIKKQWKESLVKFTSLSDPYICNISGSNVIDKLIAKIESGKTLPYKVYLVNHATIRSYAKMNGWESITKLFQLLKIGVKVFDEAHLEFENLVRIDLFTNTKKTFYLTANFERSGIEENIVFEKCFRHIVKYGVETKEEKRKHIKYLGVLYNTHPSLMEQSSVKNVHGFDKNKYCDYQIKKDKFFEVVHSMLDICMTHEGKILILLSKIDACKIMYEDLTEYLHHKGSHYTVSIYNSSIPEKEKALALERDIIISTQKSLGTGNDIKGLRSVIMTEQYSSKIIANQTAGRLREYSKEDYTFYIEIVDIGFKRVHEMYKKRVPIFKKKCAQVGEYKYK